jgi:hypothetical protein
MTLEELPYVLDAGKRISPLPQEPREVFVFPATSALIEAELAFAPVKFVGVNAAPTVPLRFVRDDGVQHFVIENVFKEPERNEFLIEPWIDANDAIFLLDRAENKIFFRTFATFAAPNDFVTAQTIVEVTRVYFVEDTAQIEIASFRFQTKLPLQWHSRSRDFSFCSFGHILLRAPFVMRDASIVRNCESGDNTAEIIFSRYASVL